jgi:hypothetical protein
MSARYNGRRYVVEAMGGGFEMGLAGNSSCGGIGKGLCRVG